MNKSNDFMCMFFIGLGCIFLIWEMNNFIASSI